MRIHSAFLFIWILILLPNIGYSQKVSIGGVVGANITEDFHSRSDSIPADVFGNGTTVTFKRWSNSRHFIAGPKIEVTFDNPFSIEVNALYREIRSSNQTIYDPPVTFPGGQTLSSSVRTTQVHTTWEFPVLAKYRFLPTDSKVNPFLAVGPSFRPAGSGSGMSHYGITAGAGLNFQVNRLNIAPTLRYTRWASGNISNSSMKRDQVEFLVGFHQTSESAWPNAFGVSPRFGVVVGVGVTGDLDRNALTPDFAGLVRAPRSKGNFIGGGMFEMDLSKSFAFEVNALWRTLRLSDAQEVVLTWEFPFLLKYRLPVKGINPFLETGPSFRASGNLNGSQPSRFGFSAGLGVEQNWKALRVAPVLRYTRWQRDPATRQWKTVPDQLEFLVGFSFGRPRP